MPEADSRRRAELSFAAGLANGVELPLCRLPVLDLHNLWSDAREDT